MHLTLFNSTENLFQFSKHELLVCFFPPPFTWPKVHQQQEDSIQTIILLYTVLVYTMAYIDYQLVFWKIRKQYKFTLSFFTRCKFSLPRWSLILYTGNGPYRSALNQFSWNCLSSISFPRIFSFLMFQVLDAIIKLQWNFYHRRCRIFQSAAADEALRLLCFSLLYVVFQFTFIQLRAGYG